MYEYYHEILHGWVGCYMVMGSNLGLDKITFFLSKPTLVLRWGDAENPRWQLERVESYDS